mmetsp:Transcript_22225/g.53166  ORF Transcript_22225/g.53166 Transcript_22225/m.53166 type:complete len:251 (+) Transcript_22225:270-1022(+)
MGIGVVRLEARGALEEALRPELGGALPERLVVVHGEDVDQHIGAPREDGGAEGRVLREGADGGCGRRGEQAEGLVDDGRDVREPPVLQVGVAGGRLPPKAVDLLEDPCLRSRAERDVVQAEREGVGGSLVAGEHEEHRLGRDRRVAQRAARGRVLVLDEAVQEAPRGGLAAAAGGRQRAAALPRRAGEGHGLTAQRAERAQDLVQRPREQAERLRGGRERSHQRDQDGGHEPDDLEEAALPHARSLEDRG